MTTDVSETGWHRHSQASPPATSEAIDGTPIVDIKPRAPAARQTLMETAGARRAASGRPQLPSTMPLQ
jgi:hypothetical protein